MKPFLLFLFSLASLSALGAGTNISRYPNTTSLQSGDTFIIERPGDTNYNVTAAQMPGELGVQPTNANLTDWGNWGTNAYANVVSNRAVSGLGSVYDPLNAGTAAATAATNAMSVSGSPLAGFVNTNRFASSNVATAAKAGIVKVDNSSITVAADGTISATTGGGGSVTSVGLSGPADLTISGSPVTTSGTLSFSRTANALADYNGQNISNLNSIVVVSITNTSLTASTLLKADANKKMGSIANGVGVLTNDTSGNFGYAPLLDASALAANQLVYTGPQTNLLSVVNNLEFEAVISPTSNATNYSADLLQARKQEVFTANTNANFTFANAATNHSIDLYINALTSTVPCIVTFPPHIRLNHFSNLVVTNGQSMYFHIDFFNGTDPTNAVVTGGDYYTIQ